MTRWVLPSRGAMGRFGEAIGNLLRPGQLVALIGDLGAGKTTLTQAIARGLGVASYVSSPTFGLVHEYAGRYPLYHFDLYRLERPDDVNDLGFYDYFERGGVVVVEWADKFPELLPADRLTLLLETDPEAPDTGIGDDSPRSVTAQADGPAYENLLAALNCAPELQKLATETKPS